MKLLGESAQSPARVETRGCEADRSASTAMADLLWRARRAARRDRRPRLAVHRRHRPRRRQLRARLRGHRRPRASRGAGGGVAAGDYDGDGWIDLYVTAGNAGPNRLFRNRGDGDLRGTRRRRRCRADRRVYGTDLRGRRRRRLARPAGAGARLSQQASVLHRPREVRSLPHLFRNRGDGTLRGRHRGQRPHARRATPIRRRSATTIATATSTSSSPTGATTSRTALPSEHLWRNDGSGPSPT